MQKTGLLAEIARPTGPQPAQRVVDYPAIQHRHQLVALRCRHETWRATVFRRPRPPFEPVFRNERSACHLTSGNTGWQYRRNRSSRKRLLYASDPLHFLAAADQGRVVFLEDLDTVPTCFFRCFAGDFCGSHNAHDTFGFAGNRGNANAGRNIKLTLCRYDIDLTHAIANIICNLVALADAAVRQQYTEFITAEACDDSLYPA